MKRKRPGRPPLGKEVKQRYQVVLEPSVAEYLRNLGGDNLSRGISIATQRSKEKK